MSPIKNFLIIIICETFSEDKLINYSGSPYSVISETENRTKKEPHCNNI